ncbi:MAG: DUF2723 domain-containing protein [Rikenellaceae bacterium]|nr:DUF2723 domain-containing protein [Rikenellaceae bacterium]
MNYFRKYDLLVGWLVFLAAAVVYLLTMEPTTSLWDCAEFIAISFKLEVGHPPGAPLFMMISRLFTIFAPGNEYAAAMVNAMSSTASAFTILFLFWTITHLARGIYRKRPEQLTAAESWTVIGAGVIGAMAYTFTDTFWFSAIEGEVYALSSMFTALVIWAMLRWENVADEPHANRWLVLIAYLMGLSIGVHILNLLTIPALVFIYYFRKSDCVTWRGVVKATLASGAILLAIYAVIMPYTVAIAAFFDRIFVNVFGLPINSGLIFFVFALFALMGWAVWFTYKRGKVLLNTIALCVTVILLGYGSYASVVIRASVNPPMNSNDPDNPHGLLRLINRDQYGSQPQLFGPAYSSPVTSIKYRDIYYIDDNGKYASDQEFNGYEYPSEFRFFFPRMYSSAKDFYPAEYQKWGQVEGRKIRYGDQMVTVPTFGENLRFFFSYQLNFMYWRYFLWNFVGRQSDIQSTGQITDGNWLSGIRFIDELYLGPQDDLPADIAGNKGRNTYYFLPFILGIIGLVYQLNRDKRNFAIVLWLFFMLGIAMVLYFNTPPGEPRERDYVYAGSFYAFCIWIGLGVMWFKDMFSALRKKESGVWGAVAATAVCSCVPVILAAQNWDDHDRSHRYVARDIGYNYLQSALPNAIVMNYGDNDTFPLWYNQEVEGVRPDIRVMNLSYLGGDWYIEEQKSKMNDSDPVPFSLPRSKYVNRTNEMLLVQDLVGGDTVDIAQVMEFILSDSPRTQYQLDENKSVDIVPARHIAIPVNKENVLASGIVRPEEAHLIADTLYLNITGNSLRKDEMMLLDLLAHFDWKRPLYFTQTLSLANLGLRDYMQFDGACFRLVPIYTPQEQGTVTGAKVGRVDIDYLYPRLMGETRSGEPFEAAFRFGNIADKRTYADSFIQNNLNSAQVRQAFARLADALSAAGDKPRAEQVIDRAIEVYPFDQLRYTYFNTVPLIEAYYNADAIEKGDALLNAYADNLMEKADYYLRFGGAFAEYVEDALQENLVILWELYKTSRKYGRDEIADRLNTYFDTLEV